ncbi:hypothetical protein F5B21DRAFT_509106 [Xylaria acuta]|nr:hypothetical protein F5B21DRAFT_509106 [Xylaria acuta]
MSWRDVFISAGVEPSQDSEDAVPAILQGALSYDSTTRVWDLKASLTGLYASTLAEFFDEGSKNHVGPLISSIKIGTMAVEYKYAAASNGRSSGSEFTINGDLLIAAISLQLNFKHTKEGFTFSATLNPEDKLATVGDILGNTLRSDIQLPGFVYNTQLVATD